MTTYALYPVRLRLPSALTQDGPCASTQMTPSERTSNAPAEKVDDDSRKNGQVQSKPWKTGKADLEGEVFWPIDDDGNEEDRQA